MKLPTIGVVGGVGPLAGATLVQKIYEDSGACCDQAQPRVLLASYPSEIPDRTTFLLGGSDTNPSVGLRRVLRDLKAGGATVAGIACVTAHAEPIFADIRAHAEEHPQLLSLTDEIKRVVESMGIKRLGVLSTKGTYQVRLFQDLFRDHTCRPVFCDQATREQVHQAIYSLNSSQFGRFDSAAAVVRSAASELIAQGAEAVLLGCTELPILLPEAELNGVPLLDPLKILAGALREVNEEQNRVFLEGLHQTCRRLCGSCSG